MRAKQTMAPWEAYVSRVQRLETNLTQTRMGMLTSDSAIIRKIEAEMPAFKRLRDQYANYDKHKLMSWRPRSAEENIPRR